MKREQTTSWLYFCRLYIALASSKPLLAGFTVQSLLAASLCRLASTEEEVLGNMAVLGTNEIKIPHE